MVEWKSIGSLLERKRVKAKDAKIPVYAVTNNAGFVLSASLHDFTIHSEDISNYLVVDKNDFAYNPSRLNIGSISYFDKEGRGAISPMYVVFHADESKVLAPYLYIVIKSETVRNKIDSLKEVGARFRFDFNRWDLIQIPLPSLSEQERIVGILDTFTSSIENLKEQISQRRKQYEHYRDKLLDLEGKPGVEMKTLGEVFVFKNGLNKGKEFFGKGKPIIMFSNVFNSRFITGSMIKNRVEISSEELERINAHIGDVFFTRTSETQEDVGYSSVLIEDVGECTYAGFLIRARPITNLLMPSYCKYCFSTRSIRDSIVSKSSFTTRASLTGGGLSDVQIPLPSLQEQSRIVSILDTFEASIKNLEAQLQARQKQYEYYREKLLNFEREK